MVSSQKIGDISNVGVSSPAMIIDEETVLISFNEQMGAFVSELENGKKFTDYLSLAEGQLFERIILSAKNSGIITSDNIPITGSKNITKEYTVIATPFLNVKGSMFFVSFRLPEETGNKNGLNRVGFIDNLTESFVKDESILNLIADIKSEYPFTLIGKSRIVSEINKIKEHIWMKSPDGKYIVVNDGFASAVGLQSFRIEGKKNEDVLPAHIAEILNQFDDYIIKTLNAIQLEGALSSLFKISNRKSKIIETPIFDIDKNIVAIVGFTQPITELEPVKDPQNIYLRMINDLNKAVITVDTGKNITAVNDHLLNMLEIPTGFDYTGTPLNSILDDAFCEQIDFFLSESSDSKELNTSFELNSKNSSDRNELNVFIRKIFNEDKKYSGAYLLFDDEKDLKTKNILREEMHELIMMKSPESMFIYNIENLKFLEVNEAALKMYGYTRDQFLQMDLTDLYAPEDIQTLIESANKVTSETTYTGPWRHKTSSGNSILVELSKTEIEFKSKKAHLNIVRDVTKEVEEKKKLQMFKASFDNSSDLIINTDCDGFITFANSTVTKYLGHSKKDLEQRPFLSLVADQDRAAINSQIFHSGVTESQTLNIEIKKLSGELVEVELTASPIKDFNDEIDSFNLIVKVKELEKKTGSVTEITKENRDNIDSAFLSNLFHEILTPINVIIGFSQELNESLEEPTDEQKESAEIIQENKILLLQIMDNAVEYASLEQSKIKLKSERIVFIDILDQLQANVKKDLQSKEIEIAYGKISSSLTFESDKQRFLSVITLLLKFTIKITKADRIFLSAYPLDNDSFSVNIKDGRGGISVQLFDNLNNLFTKDEDLLKREFGISRFMIRLARKLIEILNGKLQPLEKDGEIIEFGISFPNILEIEEDEAELAFEAEVIAEEDKAVTVEDKSKTVVEETPVSQAEEAAPPVQTAETKQVETQAETKPETATVVEDIPAPKPTVKKLTELSCLYVEDQVDSQILFKVQMKDFNSIDFANSFEKALPLIKSKQFDFIVMDINLQGEYNGLDALRIIQKLPDYQNVPVIAVTAYVLPGDREKFIAAGFIDFVAKPILRDKLMDVLKRIFQIV